MSLPERRDAGFASGRVSGVEGRNILGVRLPEEEARARFAAEPRREGDCTSAGDLRIPRPEYKQEPAPP